MKVLSVRQPYAALLVTGQKRFEARTWTTTYRGPLLIHASSSAITASTIASMETEREFLEGCAAAGWTTKEALRSLPRSAIIGSVVLVDIHPSEECDDATDRDYVLASEPDPETYFWRVTDPVAFEPVPIDGKLKVWELPSELEGVVEKNLSAATLPPAWRASDPDGESLRLFEFSPSTDLAAVIGDRPRCQRDMWNDFIAYVERHELSSGRTVRLDDKLAFLSPGKPTARMSTLAKAVARQISPFDDGP